MGVQSIQQRCISALESDGKTVLCGL